jgi:hypothetical protein
MTTIRSMAGLMFLVGALAAPGAVSADPGTAAAPASGCRCRQGGGGPGTRAFDSRTVTTLQCEILEVQRVAGRRHEGIHLTVAMGSEKLSVHLGPDFYLDAQPLKLARGDKVEVKGSRTTVDGRPVLIAQEVRRAGEVLALRDADGVPLWRGGGMRGW